MTVIKLCTLCLQRVFEVKREGSISDEYCEDCVVAMIAVDMDEEESKLTDNGESK